MAMTINPAVSGASIRRWLVHVGLYAAGGFTGMLWTYAAFRGLYLAVASLVAPVAWLPVALPLIALAALRDLGVRAPVPYPKRRQVPEWLRHMVPPGVTAFAYGAELGLGFATRFTYSTHFAFVAALALVPLPAAAAAAAAFAVAKSIVVLTSLGGSSYGVFEARMLKRHRTRLLGQKALRLTNAAIAVAVALVVATNL